MKITMAIYRHSSLDIAADTEIITFEESDEEWFSRDGEWVIVRYYLGSGEQRKPYRRFIPNTSIMYIQCEDTT